MITGRHWFPVRDALPYIGIDFGVIARFRSNFEANHGQTLETLREQGGLDWIELWCGFKGMPLWPTPPIDAEAARLYVLRTVTRLTLGGC